jgi:hypothetical protein
MPFLSTTRHGTLIKLLSISHVIILSVQTVAKGDCKLLHACLNVTTQSSLEEFSLNLYWDRLLKSVEKMEIWLSKT